MKKNIEIKKKIVSNWFLFLQLEMCRLFQEIEKDSNNKKNLIFKKKTWNKKNFNEGGGTSLILKNGNIFDKIGINQSTVIGRFEKKFRSNVLGAEKNGKYWASGISVVAHMKNPKIPAFHFNTRFIVTSKEWFGGGIDATPSHKDKNEEVYIHKKLEETCLSNNKNYKKYKKSCDNYFYLKHRREPRGIGGIFFDYETQDWEKNFKFVREVGICFMDIVRNTINKKKNNKWKKKDKEKQLYKRGRYVEFNLLYDRGTKFGFCLLYTSPSPRD